MGDSPATHFIFFNEYPRAYSQVIINKDLDTGGYTAKTCEAERTYTRVAISPPHGGHGYTKMTTRLLDRRVKKLEAGLTAEFPTPPSPKLRLACCSLYHAYSVPSEGGSGGEDKAYGLEDIARIYHRDYRSSIAVA